MKNALHLKKIVKNEEGMALVTVLAILVVIFVLGVSLMGMAATSMKMSSNDRDYQSAYYVAESGVTYEMSKVKEAVAENFKKATNADQLFSLFENDININSSFTYDSFQESFGHMPEAVINIKRMDNGSDPTGRQYQILSKGSLNNKTRTVEKTFTLSWQPQNDDGNGNGDGNFPFLTNSAVFADTWINLSGGASIDGGIGVNSSAPGSIRLSGGATISGDIYVGPNAESDVIIKPQYMTVSTPIKMPTTQTFVLPPFPDFPSFPFAADTKVSSWGNSYNIISNGNLQIDNYLANNYTLNMNQDLSFRDISITSNNTLNISVGNANRSMVVDNLNIQNGNINIVGSGKLTIYVRGNINCGAGSVINTGGNINQLEIYLKGSGNPSNPKNLQLTGAQKIYGSLYAEDADISFQGGSGFQGEILTGGKNVNIGGGANANTQLFFAPNADFKLSGGGYLKGIIIGKSFTGIGGSTVIYEPLDFSKLPFFTEIGSSNPPGSNDPGGSNGSSGLPGNILSIGATRELK